MTEPLTVLVTGATGFIGRRLVPELVERGHDRPGDDPPARGVRRSGRARGRRRPRRRLAHRRAQGRGCRDLPRALPRRPRLRAQGRRGGADLRAGRCRGRGLADRLHGRARRRRREPLPAPAFAPRGRGAARRGGSPGHRAAGRDRRRRGRHLLGADPPAGQEPAGDGGPALGLDADPADRGRRRHPLPRRRDRQGGGPRPGVRDRRGGPADLPRDAPGRGRGVEVATGCRSSRSRC